MLKEKEAVIRKAAIIFDGIVISIAFLLAYLLRLYFHKFYILNLIPNIHVVDNRIGAISEYLLALIVIVPVWCLMLYLNGMYRSMRLKSFSEILSIIIKSSFLSYLAFGAVVYLIKLKLISRMFFAIFIITSLFFIVSEKLVIYFAMHYIRKRGYNYRRLLIVGTGRRAANFIARVEKHPEWGFKIIGAINDEPSRKVEKVKGVNIIGSIKEITQIIHTYAIDEVVFVVPRLRLNYIENAIYACEIEGIKATIVADLFDAKIAKARSTELDGIPLITFETTKAKEWQLYIKRAVDIVISALGLIIFSPLFLLVIIMIKITSSGPVFFKQERSGLNGRNFILYKFRTMYKDAEKRLSELRTLNEMNGPVFKIKRDPRITPLGRVLRKFSIDELPQLFNVLAGHMSLIGPRPPIPEEVEQYEPWQRRRLSMRPGLTCLWQINGRNRVDFDEWMKLDLEYLDNWSLWLDFKILVKTIPVVLFGIGAY